MSAETPHISHHLPAVSEDVFRTALLQYNHAPKGLFNATQREVAPEAPDLAQIAYTAARESDVDMPNGRIVSHLFVMAGLLRRQSVIEHQSRKFSELLEADTPSPLTMEGPTRFTRLRAFLSRKMVLHTLPPLIYNSRTADDLAAVDVMKTKGLVESRPKDAMSYFFSGDFFLDDFDPEDRRFMGETALRLYGYMNNAGQR